MQSDRPDGAQGRELQFKAAEALAAMHFGLDLKRYPTAQIESLLSALSWAPLNDDGAVARVLSVCSVGETMFMRHPDQFRALRNIVINGNFGESNRPLSIWSAGCSTGEEAYSLAALLAGYPRGVRVLGTDVSDRSIEKAKSGRYRYWSLRGVDPVTTESWLELDSMSAEVRSPIRHLVEFKVHNLMGDVFPENVDIIFCRNVLLYFREDTAAAVLQKFYDALNPSGILFVGYVDPIPAPETPFEECHDGHVRYYRKPARSADITIPAVRTLPPPPPDEILGAATLPRAPRLPSFRHHEKPPERPIVRSYEPSTKPPTRPPTRPPTKSPSEAPKHAPTRSRLHEQLGLARSLCSQGSRDDALAILRDLSDQYPLEVEPCVLTAMVADEAGLSDIALAAARRAYFLAPETPVTPFLLAMCLDQVGQRKTAEIRYAEALETLDQIKDPLAPLAFAEGMTVYQLRRTIDARLHAR